MLASDEKLEGIDVLEDVSALEDVRASKDDVDGFDIPASTDVPNTFDEKLEGTDVLEKVSAFEDIEQFSSFLSFKSCLNLPNSVGFSVEPPSFFTFLQI